MIDTLARKARQLVRDPVLRRWLIGRAIGRNAGAPAFIAHRPPYIDAVAPLAGEAVDPPAPFAELPQAAPTQAIVLPLPGGSRRLEPGQEHALFDEHFEDRERHLAVHRFAWLPLLGADADPAWVQALWRIWRRRHGEPAMDWAWHPYTTAERAINMLDFGRRCGLPGPLDDTLAVLADHGPAIARRLEYFGDHDTSNHLANDGRGLYLLGLELGLGACAELGGRILVHEAERIFRPSGVLGEGSSHYHLLLTKQYASAWLAARAHARPEADALRRITAKALAVVPRLLLPGGVALIGDVSPDCPPEYLDGLGDDRAAGWLGGLDGEGRAAFRQLCAERRPVAVRDLAADGWLRADFEPWSGLWHAAPDGWSQMPGHGHQDVGGFEAHCGAQAVFVDPGRGAYGDSTDAAFYVSGAAHNTVLVDGADPYPPNKPYYGDAFRRRIGGPRPELYRESDGVRLRHAGFARLGGVGNLTRRWRFDGPDLTIADSLEGTGRHRITQLLHTPLAVERSGDDIVLRGDGVALRIRGDGEPEVRPSTRWTAYGRGEPATAIVYRRHANLPWQSTMHIEAV